MDRLWRISCTVLAPERNRLKSRENRVSPQLVDERLIKIVVKGVKICSYPALFYERTDARFFLYYSPFCVIKISFLDEKKPYTRYKGILARLKDLRLYGQLLENTCN